MRTVSTLTMIAALLGVLAVACDYSEPPERRFSMHSHRGAQSRSTQSRSTSDASTAASQAPGEKIEVPPPPFSKGMFPCTECHEPDLPVNTKRRKLKRTHEEIDLQHDAEHRWCFDCHSAKERDKLHLASGELVDFNESYKLCGQCHGDKYRDWRAGIHGRRSGDWNGHKTYLLCVHCHNSHSPKFQPLKPMPAPVRPQDLVRGGRDDR